MLTYLLIIETEEDRRKFERLYIEYKQKMFNASNKILNNHVDAEDAVHNSFLRIIDNLDKIDETDCHKTQAFLVIIVMNISKTMYNKRKKENSSSIDELELWLESKEKIDNIIDHDGLLDLISTLPNNYSTVLLLKFMQGYNDKEIADFLEIKPDNVRQRLVRARNALSRLLENVEKKERENES